MLTGAPNAEVIERYAKQKAGNVAGVERMIRTSRGPVVVDIDDWPRFGGLHITVQPFADDGWEQKGKTWLGRSGHHRRDETLPEFLAEALLLPQDEADQLAEEISTTWFEEWERRGGREEARKLARATHILLVALLAAVLLSVTAIVLLVWLILR